jgi:L-threonylcarbamoyladenylate synthase
MTGHMTALWKVDPQQPKEQDIARAAETIVRGELVAFPTETVYGLGANALDPEAVLKIFKAKGRPSSDPLIVHLEGPQDLALVSSSQPENALKLARAFWPGPLTLLLPKSDRIPPEVTAGLQTVAVRVPAHAVALNLLRACGVPIAAPSANRFGHASPTTAQHVLDDLFGRVDVVLDAGPTPLGVESTVLDILSQPPVILRPGGLPREQIEAIIGPVRLAQAGELLSSSPGRLARHYAPWSRTILCTGMHLQDHAAKEGRKVGVIAVSEGLQLMGPGPFETCDLGPMSDLPQVARRLFAGLRSLEGANVDLVLAHTLPAIGLGLAINDRLGRAASRLVAASNHGESLPPPNEGLRPRRDPEESTLDTLE